MGCRPLLMGRRPSLTEVAFFIWEASNAHGRWLSIFQISLASWFRVCMSDPLSSLTYIEATRDDILNFNSALRNKFKYAVFGHFFFIKYIFYLIYSPIVETWQKSHPWTRFIKVGQERPIPLFTSSWNVECTFIYVNNNEGLPSLCLHFTQTMIWLNHVVGRRKYFTCRSLMLLLM